MEDLYGIAFHLFNKNPKETLCALKVKYVSLSTFKRSSNTLLQQFFFEK